MFRQLWKWKAKRVSLKCASNCKLWGLLSLMCCFALFCLSAMATQTKTYHDQYRCHRSEHSNECVAFSWEPPMRSTNSELVILLKWNYWQSMRCVVYVCLLGNSLWQWTERYTLILYITVEFKWRIFNIESQLPLCTYAPVYVAHRSKTCF